MRMNFLGDFRALLPCRVCVFLQSHPYGLVVHGLLFALVQNVKQCCRGGEGFVFVEDSYVLLQMLHRFLHQWNGPNFVPLTEKQNLRGIAEFHIAQTNTKGFTDTRAGIIEENHEEPVAQTNLRPGIRFIE